MKSSAEGNKLAIVIPLYKIKYFEKTLQSLVLQSNKEFNLYVGDDASPDSPQQLVEKYQGLISIKYIRYESNLGSSSLTAHWMRCLSLIQDEGWICFLPDDDILSPNYVDEFYKAINTVNALGVNVMKSSVLELEVEESVIGGCASNFSESNLNFYKRLLKGFEMCTLGDLIFRKSTFLQLGGFVSFPLGWGSDHATALSMARGSGIYHIKQAYLYFRMSGENISSQTSDANIKMLARVKFALWLKRNECIFPENPDEEFWRYFYWKGEYYFLNVWPASLSLWIQLAKLNVICMPADFLKSSIKALVIKLRRI